MLKYFPFAPAFDLKMGTASLMPDHPVVEIDENYRDEILLKRKLLQQDHSYYYKAAPATTSAQWEVVEKVLTGLSLSHPEIFHFTKVNSRASWVNKLLDEKF